MNKLLLVSQCICIFVSMDDNIIYYLVLGAIYLISRLLKKKKPVKPITQHQQKAEDQRYYEAESQSVPEQPQRSSSFEDLLKEISQEFSDRREPKPMISVVDESAIEPVLEKKELTREQKYVEKRHKEASDLAKREQLIRLAEEKDEHEAHGVLELLQEEGGAANAIIFAEIMNRKY